MYVIELTKNKNGNYDLTIRNAVYKYHMCSFRQTLKIIKKNT